MNFLFGWKMSGSLSVLIDGRACGLLSLLFNGRKSMFNNCLLLGHISLASSNYQLRRMEIAYNKMYTSPNLNIRLIFCVPHISKISRIFIYRLSCKKAGKLQEDMPKVKRNKKISHVHACGLSRTVVCMFSL